MVGERRQKSLIDLSWEGCFVGRALLLLLSGQAAAGGEICAGVGGGGTASTNGRRTITLQVLATTCVTSQRRRFFTRAHDGRFSVCASSVCCMWRGVGLLKQRFVQRRMLLAMETGIVYFFPTSSRRSIYPTLSKPDYWNNTLKSSHIHLPIGLFCSPPLTLS